MSELTALHQPANASDFSPETALYRVGGKLSFIPSLPMIQMRMLELRKRRGLMFTVILLTLGLPVIVLGILEITHLLKPSTYGLPGSPSLFAHLTDPMSLFGFVIGATLGATAGSTDITEGFFRLLVATGRSRISMYFSRMAAGSAIILPLVGLGFTILCLVTCFAGKPQSQYVNVSGIEVPINLSETQLQTWLLNHPNQISNAIGQSVGPQSVGPNGGIIVGGSGKHVNPNAQLPNSNYVNPKSFVKSDIGSIFSGYIYQEVSSINPSNFEMIKVGLWLELVTFMGFIIGLSLGATMGQRTVPTILLLVLQIIITPILSSLKIPYFLNGQRMLIGIALTQLRPLWTLGGIGGGGGGNGPRVGGVNSLGIPSLPTWAMIVVILLWAIGFTLLGIWRMTKREA